MIIFRSNTQHARRITLATLATLVLLVFVGAAPAFAGSPWWRLISTSQPSYLQPGQAKGEVQQVTVGPGVEKYRLAGKSTGLFGRGNENSVELVIGEAPEQVRKALEGLYGKGNIEVTENTTTKQKEEHVQAYEVKFVGELTDLPVGLMEGGAAVKEVAKGRSDGQVVLTAVNLGDANASPGAVPITVSDVLPPGLHALAIEGAVDENLGFFGSASAPLECSLGSLRCAFTGKPPASAPGFEFYPLFVPPYELIRVRVAVNLTGGASSGEANVATVTGGGAPAVTAKQPITVSATPPVFGVSAYEIRPEAQGGGPDTQAGSHPFQLTTTLNLNETFEGRAAGGLAKDLHFKVPPGLVGNATVIPQCTLAHFLASNNGEGNECSTQTVVGVARVTIRLFTSGIHEVVPFAVPLYNLEPAAGEPARFGFIVRGTPVLLNIAVRTGSDYGVTVNVLNITQQVEFLSNEVTFWGVPGDERHNNARGTACLNEAERAAQGLLEPGVCPSFEEHNPPPLISLPTSCTGWPLETNIGVDSWAEPHNVLSFSDTEPMATLDGCNRLPFEPQVKVTPDGQAGSTPTGLNVDVHVPQDSVLSANGLAEANVRNTTVALPLGVAINPAGGDGLEACSEGLVGYLPGESSPPSELHFTPRVPGSTTALAAGENAPLEPGVNFCANASKVGEVTIKTPLLPKAQPVKGFVYLAAQEQNPFGSLVAMYVVVEDPVSGIVIKLAGTVHLTETGQIVATFENTPQAAFEDAEFHFFGGERAPLASPTRCGAYTTSASITPWSSNEAVGASSTFDVTSGPHGTPCPGASLPFSPSLTGGTTNINAGGFSPFTMTMSREDGQQSLQSVQLKMPPGLSGLLSGVELCPEPQADQGTCGPNSLIGETIVSVGLGGDPFSVKGGRVYVTGPYEGAPFGLSIVNPAKAGPFDLASTKANHPACDCVLVRAKIEVDPRTADLTITSDNTGPYKIPTIIEGIPLQIKHVNVTINRPGFTFNPTNCDPLQLTGSLDSTEGSTQALAVPFQATNCAVLGFKPGFKVSTSGKTSRANGASLSVKLTYPKAPFGSQANIKSVKVDLPKQLPSRLTTLQKACTAAQFEANPAGCPPASMVGHASAITPLIPVPLSGPAYFVSYGGAKFPELVIVLQGYGVTLDLHGETFIDKAGITSSTFKTVPDAPVGSFELTLPQGKYSALAANGNLCKSKLAMPTAFTAQNGMTIHESTPISVTGCAKKKAHKANRHRKKR